MTTCCSNCRLRLTSWKRECIAYMRLRQSRDAILLLVFFMWLQIDSFIFDSKFDLCKNTTEDISDLNDLNIFLWWRFCSFQPCRSTHAIRWLLLFDSTCYTGAMSKSFLRVAFPVVFLIIQKWSSSIFSVPHEPRTASNICTIKMSIKCLPLLWHVSKF